MSPPIGYVVLNAALLGVQANLQGVLFDPGTGAFFGSQGIEVRVGK
jgi:hypothetical protein